MQSWKELLVQESATLRTAMEVIDQTGLQTALVTSSDSTFVGTLSDGDIRRAILLGANLSDSVSPFVNRNPITISDVTEVNRAFEVMDRLALRCIPLIRERQVVDVVFYKSVSSLQALKNTVLIMAGGRGERLKPLTDDTPKPLMRVGGRSVLEILLDRLGRAGLTNIWISVHYLSDRIEDLCGTGERFGVSISYVREKEPLGTVGAYMELPQEFRSTPVVIVNADLITSVNFFELIASHETSRAEITMGVIKHTMEVPYGVVRLEDGRVTSIEEKPSITSQIYAGIGVYSPSAFDGYHQGKSINATDIFMKLLLENRRISAFEISEYWRDIGTFDSLEGANYDLGVVKNDF